MNVLFVLTSHSALGNTGKKTGFWVEEFAAPYYVISDKGVNVTIASPMGGQPPVDPKSEAPDAQTAATKRFYADAALQEKLAHTKKLADVSAADFDAVFYPGGHGPMWDLYDDKHSITLIQNFWAAGKPLAAVCHAPAALLNVKNEKGEPLVKGKKVTGFTNSEEEGVQLTNVVPYLLEDELKAKGGNYSSGNDWSVYVVEDGMLITGQNPASSEEAAKKLLALLEAKS
ncbi:type 1 glutamine amidotransferase domain-containing protein [Panacibacter sp. DH6]|uniref:Type 1 glutamine amidotransferase domain-containing protein n=1 Tax=Panacibacter microcysteis TaxID=2793269 RepID=A0A931DZG0_9BACT|nr:type 1 glutamine amidotransferase domain-containing protein [Panacibacter microcysteis]MBG9374610.1 type 1 glutamine amidotransferase domain-containing protein [Panacibacter microcysteis]